MHRKMPLVLLIEIIAISLLTPFMPLILQKLLFTMSLTIKSGIVFMLPFIIFGLLFKTMVGLAKQATFIIAFILLLVCTSNATTTFLSHYVGEGIFHLNMSIITPQAINGLTPFWLLNLPKLIANDKAMLSGIALGIILGNFFPAFSQSIAKKLDEGINKLLSLIIYIIPVFIAGFVVKLQCDGVITTLAKDYTKIFSIIALSQFSYIIFMYLGLNRFNFKNTIQSIKNMIPAVMTGFSTMSSAAAMPFTIAGVKRNTENKDLASSIIPVTVNIHLVGDCIAIPILAYAVIKSFGLPEPALMTYLIFVFYFVLAKFSVAAIPGGGILVMLPILEHYLGFNAEMLSLITALYILFDPVITSANVLGNGAFALMIDKLQGQQASIATTAILDETMQLQ